MWTMAWDHAGAERAIAAALDYRMDFIEIALLSPAKVDAAHSRRALEKAGLPSVCSLGLPEGVRASTNPEGAKALLRLALDQTAAIGALALTGVTYGGIGAVSRDPLDAAIADGIQRSASGVTNRVVDRGLAIPPTIRVGAGTRVTVIVTRRVVELGP
jgi:D-psicose/D-tagatose/L-ribulose 3-epimerase